MIGRVCLMVNYYFSWLAGWLVRWSALQASRHWLGPARLQCTTTPQPWGWGVMVRVWSASHVERVSVFEAKYLGN